MPPVGGGAIGPGPAGHIIGGIPIGIGGLIPGTPGWGIMTGGPTGTPPGPAGGPPLNYPGAPPLGGNIPPLGGPPQGAPGNPLMGIPLIPPSPIGIYPIYYCNYGIIDCIYLSSCSIGLYFCSEIYFFFFWSFYNSSFSL